ncbi:MAG TPA: ClpXP protease specificity-enhancing factor SspB [Polyangiaceae bacterium]|nr:ClpXP protease specificity-enhancing factor SspB [Polyangiaceae bacterium]
MASPPRLPAKKDVALALLEQSTVFVHLDPRGEAVRVPPWFKKQPQLVLQVGLNMAVPIPDLEVSDDALSCTLSFNRSPHFCSIPWTSVFALIGENGRGMVWPEDVPPEVAAQAARQQAKEKPKLHAVPEQPSPAPEPAPEARPKARRSRKPRGERAEKERPARATRQQPQPEPAARQAASTQKSESNKTDAASPPRTKRELPPYLRVIK